MDDTIRPPDFDQLQLDQDLLETYVIAVGWVDGAQSAKQHKAWTDYADKCRKEILRRMT